VIAATNAGVVVGLQWRDSDGRETTELFQVVRLREGKIVDMEDYRDRHKALNALTAAA
jgi:hypothetical protein